MTQYLPRTNVSAGAGPPQQYYRGANGQRRWQKVAPYWYNLSPETANAAVIVQEPSPHASSMWASVPNAGEVDTSTAITENYYQQPTHEETEVAMFMSQATSASSLTDQLHREFEQLTPDEKRAWLRKEGADSSINHPKDFVDFWTLDGVQSKLNSIRDIKQGAPDTKPAPQNPLPALVVAAVVIGAIVWYGQSH